MWRSLTTLQYYNLPSILTLSDPLHPALCFSVYSQEDLHFPIFDIFIVHCLLKLEYKFHEASNAYLFRLLISTPITSNST